MLARFERLDHANAEELLDHPADLLPERAWLLRTVRNKIERYPERFARRRDDYLANASLIAMSGWDEARCFCMCGIRGRNGRGRACQLWKLCPACSYRKRKTTALAAYLTRFHRTSWYMVTVSYQTTFSDSFFDHEDVQLCWRAASKAIYHLQQAGYLRGAMTRHELHLESLLPLQYHPHLHAVLDADEVNRTILAEEVFAYRCPETGARIAVPVSIQHHRLNSERALANALSYLGKSLDLATPYRAAWPLAAANNRRLVPELNRNKDEFLDDFWGLTSDARQITYCGTCHAASGRTLRVPAAERRDQREVISAILTDAQLDSWDEGESEPATTFRPPPATP